MEIRNTPVPLATLNPASKAQEAPQPANRVEQSQPTNLVTPPSSVPEQPQTISDAFSRTPSVDAGQDQYNSLEFSLRSELNATRSGQQPPETQQAQQTEAQQAQQTPEPPVEEPVTQEALQTEVSRPAETQPPQPLEVAPEPEQVQTTETPQRTEASQSAEAESRTNGYELSGASFNVQPGQTIDQRV